MMETQPSRRASKQSLTPERTGTVCVKIAAFQGCPSRIHLVMWRGEALLCRTKMEWGSVESVDGLGTGTKPSPQSDCYPGTTNTITTGTSCFSLFVCAAGSGLGCRQSCAHTPQGLQRTSYPTMSRDALYIRWARRRPNWDLMRGLEAHSTGFYQVCGLHACCTPCATCPRAAAATRGCATACGHVCHIQTTRRLPANILASACHSLSKRLSLLPTSPLRLREGLGAL
ncbi:hypothetical protein M011DRAFT_56093 [Sporormia fimetaria CBS 119925]|uniref:Uncharacterized protein n=1 Tax=Sporormia fimetaria CBS 119925 TaxID=1340428 RepID=A0A6A6VCM0_9PLEO|nr:hypothetical protein M011DRAFT_56093 [Sporormia fimetaria CBS 119925]